MDRLCIIPCIYRMGILVKIIIIIVILFPLVAFAEHLYKEKDYQEVWCKAAGGITEYVLDDGARVDCLTDEYAIEFDFGPKWAESVGQSLYYSLKTGKKAGIVLIIENDEGGRYLNRLNAVASLYNIKVWKVGPENL